MSKSGFVKSVILASVFSLSIATGVFARDFNIPAGDLGSALGIYTTQSGVALIVSDEVVKGINTKGVVGSLSADDALSRLLTGTGLTIHRENGGVTIVRNERKSDDSLPMHMAAAATPTASGAALETVTVTSSKVGGDIQNIPISITALSRILAGTGFAVLRESGALAIVRDDTKADKLLPQVHVAGAAAHPHDDEAFVFFLELRFGRFEAVEEVQARNRQSGRPRHVREEMPPTHPACHGFPLIREGGSTAQEMNLLHGRPTQLGRKYVTRQGLSVCFPRPVALCELDAAVPRTVPNS